MQKIFIALLITIVIIFYGCFPGKVIEGRIESVSGNVVQCNGIKFKVQGTAPLPGSLHYFTPTVKRKLINSIRLK